MKKSVLAALTVLAAVATFLLFFNNGNVNNNVPEPNTQQLHITNSSIAAFDYDGLHNTVTNARLYNGDGMMFLKLGANNKIYYFSSLDELQPYDPNHMGYIALNNPDFGQYYLGRYLADQRTLVYENLQQAGIAAIILNYNQQNLIASADVVLLDNSRRNISIVPINDSFLKLATLQPADHHADQRN